MNPTDVCVNLIDIIAIIIAGISLIISIVVARIQFSQQRAIHRASLNSKYHDEIFLEHLIYKIPESRKYIRFNEDGKLDDTDMFTDELNQMLNRALYYKYKDNAFYKRLKEKIQEIEDYVMACGNKSYEQEEQADVYKIIQEKLEEMYKLINNQYLGC